MEEVGGAGAEAAAVVFVVFNEFTGVTVAVAATTRGGAAIGGTPGVDAAGMTMVRALRRGGWRSKSISTPSRLP